MTEWVGGDEPYYGPRDDPGPSRRREDGMIDFRNGLIKRSDDRHYVAGYELARRLWGSPETKERPADDRG